MLQLAVLCVVGSFHPQARGADFVWALHGGLRLTQQNNYFNSTSVPLGFDQDVTGATFLFGALGLLSVNRHLEISGTLDVGEVFLGNGKRAQEQKSFWLLLNGGRLNLSAQQQDNLKQLESLCVQQVQDLQASGRTGISTEDCKIWPWFLQESFFLRELYASFYPHESHWVKLDVGMFRRKIGRAFVYDNYSLGLRLSLEPAKLSKEALPIRIGLDALVPNSSFTPEGKKSPLFNLEVEVSVSKQARFGGFFTYIYDGDNRAGRLLLPLWQELFANQWNELFYRISGKDPKLSCYQEPRTDALKVLLPREDRNKQESCEQENLQRAARGEEPLLCPLDKLLSDYETSCTVPASQGHHFWAGVHGDVRWYNVRVRALAILYFSWMTVGLPPVSKPSLKELTFSLRSGGTGVLRQAQTQPTLPRIEDKKLRGLGFAGELELSYQWSRFFSTTLFIVFATGDNLESEEKEVTNIFMGISPQLRHTNIFFNGGINAASSKRGVSIAGISGKGFLAAGFKMEYLMEEKFTFRFVATPLWSHARPVTVGETLPAGGFYGFELNLMSSYRLFPWLRPVAQVDLFFPGTFFVESRPPPVLFQLQLGVDVLF